MKRIGFVLMAGVSVGISYLTVVIGLGGNAQFNAVTVASIALPALVSGLVMVAYIVWDVRERRVEHGDVSALSAQLVRKEIEIDRLSSVDELTGLHTRHHFTENLALEYERAMRYNRPLALLLIEIDDAETLGEPARKLSKSYLLAEVAALVRAELRANDLGGRYMPDVLAVLLPETSPRLAQGVAERVRSLLSTREFFGRRFGVEIGLTISQGIAMAPAEGVDGADALVRAAQAALQMARSAGTGQIHMYEPPRAIRVSDTADEGERLAG
ncbi:MAG TPA: GGDEF domain-containing protein [Dehalococcoidia bacterium]|nr:GGDEF domain-containing protein [Dehalococcoidia bacterium]